MFFFQAEDGIRVFHVTGVQTCALPILGLATPNSDACRIYVDGQPYAWRDGEDVMFDETYVHWVKNETDVTRVILFCDIERPLSRSEERRVGKEGDFTR